MTLLSRDPRQSPAVTEAEAWSPRLMNLTDPASIEFLLGEGAARFAETTAAGDAIDKKLDTLLKTVLGFPTLVLALMTKTTFAAHPVLLPIGLSLFMLTALIVLWAMRSRAHAAPYRAKEMLNLADQTTSLKLEYHFVDHLRLAQVHGTFIAREINAEINRDKGRWLRRALILTVIAAMLFLMALGV